MGSMVPQSSSELLDNSLVAERPLLGHFERSRDLLGISGVQAMIHVTT